MAWFRLLVCLAALLPATLAMREAVLSRRSTLVAAVLAAAPVPRYSALRAEGLQTEGLQASRARCRTLAIGEMLGESREACEARVADTPQQSMLSDGAKTSPLIEQLKQRTAANKEYNSRYVKVVTAGANSGVYDAERNLRLVRLDGVPKLLAPDDIKKLEVDCNPMHRGCNPVCLCCSPMHPGEGLRGTVPRQRGDAVRGRARQGRQRRGPHAVRPGDSCGCSRSLPVRAQSLERTSSLDVC